MPCQTVTVQAPNSDIGITSMNVNPGQNVGTVSYTVQNDGGGRGSVEVEVTADIHSDGSNDATERFSHTLNPGNSESNEVSFQFDRTQDTQVKFCARKV